MKLSFVNQRKQSFNVAAYLIEQFSTPPYLISKELISKIYNELKKLDIKINNPFKMKYRPKERIANIENSND